jgi:hypothetical protein
VAQRADGDRGWTAAKGVPRFFACTLCARILRSTRRSGEPGVALRTEATIRR